MRRFLYFSFFIFLFSLLPTTAHAAVGDWRVYASYYGASRVVTIHNRVYVQAYGGVYSYDPEDTSVETFDKGGVMSDTGIFSILACRRTNELIVLYNNGNIDLLDADGEVYNMPDLKLKILNDKTLNDAMVDDDGMLYLSTGSGIVCVDIPRRSFGDFFSFGHAVNSMALLDGSIYAVTNDGVFRGKRSDNLLDPSSWTMLRDMKFIDIIEFNGQLYASTGYYAARVTDYEKFYLKSLINGQGKIIDWTVADGSIIAIANEVLLVTADDQVSPLAGAEGVQNVVYSNGTYWAACGDEGLRGLKFDKSALEFTETMASVIPNSPRRNYSYKLVMPQEGRMLMTGGAFNYNGEPDRAGTIMQLENGTWTSFDEDGPMESIGARNYKQITDIVQDPADPTHHFAAAATSGLYEFRDQKFVTRYNYDNSPLVSASPSSSRPEYYVRTTGLAYDDDQNLWMCNNEVDTVLRILRHDGKWASYYSPEIARQPTFDHIMFDRRGWLWTNSRRTVLDFRAGIFVLDTNGTLDNTADDRRRFLTTFQNQDGTEYVPNLCNCMVEDLDGAVWLGYDRGVFVIYDPSEFFDSDLRLTQIKVPRDDGTNLADYLLSEVPVKCITVDGGNRKWIGTTGSGLFLVSADGLETLAHFTVDNSPLPSDEIYDVAIDGTTGEVFISTDGGLVSYQGDATDPVDEYDDDRVVVYPNPVRPEHQGNIVVTGLKYDTDVKIVNAAGRLVNQGTSVGGSYTWNCRLPGGSRCANGIYYILGADSEGKKGVVGKFLVVSQ